MPGGMRLFPALATALLLCPFGCASSAPGASDTDEQPCAVDAATRARVDAIVGAAVSDAVFVLSESRGTSAPFDRAFGVEAPLGGPSNRGVATLEAACSTPIAFEAECARPEGARASDTTQLCKRVACEEGGGLAATAWSTPGGLAPAQLLPGEVQVSDLDHATRFTPRASGGTTVAWRTSYRVSPAGQPAAAVSIEGSAVMGIAAAPPVSLKITVAEPDVDAIVISLEIDADGVHGGGSAGARPVSAVTPEGVRWVGACGGDGA
jgi:hypothetical protein